MTEWSSAEQTQAAEEGWYVSVGAGILATGMKFEGSDRDEHAAAYVVERANEGSEFHRRALSESARRRLTYG